ncbi:hypothetical protein ANN_04679 [Periplaneta americana]|uniref:Uncharacterized protein n=1 Tax=Periplaneta americana TaxID=6978 RepID=A0ABQ8TAN3_PERAM|nr:hypothetical protein ANN_04679 [Periplaneta americana]
MWDDSDCLRRLLSFQDQHDDKMSDTPKPPQRRQKKYTVMQSPGNGLVSLKALLFCFFGVPFRWNLSYLQDMGHHNQHPKEKSDALTSKQELYRFALDAY